MGLFVDLEFDETDVEETKRIRAFLDDYKQLCMKHACLVVADGEDVQVVPSEELANEDDPWGVEEMTKSRGWKL